MPIYEYACKNGHLTEVFQKLSDKPPKACPRCGAKLERVLSRTSFQLKGGGWYKDLYSSVKPEGESSEAAPSDDKGEAKGEVKSDAKTEAKSDAKVEAKPGAKADAKPEAKASPTKAEGKPAAKPSGKASSTKPTSPGSAKQSSKGRTSSKR